MTHAQDALLYHMELNEWKDRDVRDEMLPALAAAEFPPNKISHETIRSYRTRREQVNPTFFKNALDNAGDNEELRAMCMDVINGYKQDTAPTTTADDAPDSLPSSPAAPDDEPDSTINPL